MPSPACADSHLAMKVSSELAMLYLHHSTQTLCPQRAASALIHSPSLSRFGTFFRRRCEQVFVCKCRAPPRLKPRYSLSSNVDHQASYRRFDKALYPRHSFPCYRIPQAVHSDSLARVDGNINRFFFPSEQDARSQDLHSSPPSFSVV